MTRPVSAAELKNINPDNIDQPTPIIVPGSALVKIPTPAVQTTEAPTSWSLTRWLTSILAVCAVAAIAWIYGAPIVLGPVVIPTPVVRADLVQTLVASGHVETPFRVTVSSQVSGVVADVPVMAGDKVKAGDTLIVLDDSTARATVLQANGVVAQAEARIRQLRELTLPTAEQNLAKTKVDLVNAQEIYDRTAKLASSGVVTRVARHEAKKNLDVARAQSQSAELSVLSSTEGGSDYVLVATQLAQAQAALVEAQSRLGTYIVKAARDGVVISRTVEAGNVVQPGIELMQLSPSGDALVVVQVDEKNLGLMTVGQPALVSADAYPKETFPATVDFINPSVDLQRASVEVKLAVADPPKYLREDMTVSVDVEVARKPKALIVDAANLHELKDGAAWVFKVDAGTAKKQAVKVGLVNSGKAEVLGGLVEGDQIIPVTATTVADGKRVRVSVAPVIKK
jgi:HlyD family secretion protein